MSEIILGTKLFVPTLRPFLIPRPHLVEQLNRGVHGNMTLISAPAGFGKSTLVVAWLQQLDRPAAWLSLDANDDDPLRFFTYLIAALQTVDPHIGVDLAASLRATPDMAITAVIPTLINELATSALPFVLILDDFHVIRREEIHHAIAQFVDYLPPTVHLVITSRDEPPLPLPRWRVRGQLTEVQLDDLRLTPEETSRFLRETMTLEVGETAVSLLANRTEGWLAGLQLAAISLRNSNDSDQFITEFTGSNRQIADYLVQEVLSQQPESVHRFLLQTSVLSQFNASLCDFLLEAQNSQAILDSLDQANLFIIPLDGERNWYRYHHLFGELLRHRLRQERGETAVAHLHRQAAAWYANNKLLDEAISHLFHIPDYEQAAKLIATLSLEQLFDDSLGLRLQHWIEQFPKQQLRNHPYVAALMMIATTMSGDIITAESYFQLIKDDSSTQPFQDLFRSIYVRNLEEDFEKALRYLERILTADSHIDETILARAWLQKANIYYQQGQFEDVDDALEEARHIISNGRSGSDSLYLQIVHMQAVSLQAQGDFERVEKLCLTEIESATQYKEGQPITIGYLYNVLAAIYYSKNALTQSAHFANLAFGLAQRTGNVDILLNAVNVKAKLACVAKEITALHTALEQVEIRFGLLNDVRNELGYQEYLIRYRFWLGELQPAIEWADASPIQYDDVPQLHQFETYHTYCAIRLAQARQLAQVHHLPDLLTLIQRLELITVQARHLEALVQSLLLKALANELIAQGSGLPILQRAVELAAPSQIVRVFLDWGEPVQRLLAQLEHDDASFGARLLRLMGKKERTPQSTLWQLTARESEILQLIADGFSNKEIEETLIISKNTVRTHIKNLYSKLDVTSRTQAIKKAQERKLLA